MPSLANRVIYLTSAMTFSVVLGICWVWWPSGYQDGHNGRFRGLLAKCLSGGFCKLILVPGLGGKWLSGRLWRLRAFLSPDGQMAFARHLQLHFHCGWARVTKWL